MKLTGTNDNTVTKQIVETLAQEYCEKITEANAEWIKKVRIN